ncbi:MAG: outer membrane beta-barrel protein [Prevotella sp.]|nr:outer membrane beta-barrel protein [Prevotella sp.]
MYKNTFITILFALIAVAGHAQQASQGDKEGGKKKKEKTISLMGYASDSFTKARVPKDSLKVYLLSAIDSVVVDTADVWESWNYTGINSTGYDFTIPAHPAKYIIKATHPDYETTYKNYEVKKIGRNRYFELPALRMRRLRRDYDKEGGYLDEVVVTATKVKMVYKGDTIVYNADAFNIPEGSMLDALIKQLPGVELKENGEIYVNGKKIDNLTLNGADFFKGKNKMMLENLPYYTVKNVEVFNKSTPRSQFTGRDVEQKEYTMDVVLKREYHVGGTAYVEGGYGTDNRYRGKGFGMRYSDHSRAILFGGANNLNEYIDFDREGNDRSRTEASGDRDVRQTGGAWSLHASEDRATNTLEYDLKWEDTHSESRQQSENYLAGASTFGKSNSEFDNLPFSFNTRNTFMLQKPFFMYSWLDVRYNHGHNKSESESLTARDVLFGDSINLNRSRNRSKSDQMNFSFQNQVSVKLPWGDMLELRVNLHSQRTWNSRSFSQDSYTFYNTGVIDQRNQYHNSPSKGFSAIGRMGYGIQLTEHFTLQPFVGINYDFSNNDNNRYRLDWLGADWVVGGPHPMGTLPTPDVLDTALDHTNSSEQDTRLNTTTVGAEINYSKPIKNGQVYFLLQLTEKYLRNHMRYDNDMLHAAINKNYRSPQAFFNYYIAWDNYHKYISGYLENSIQLPNIGQMVDITSTANPLNIVRGNPDLKPMNLWSGNMSFSSRTDSIDQNIRVSLFGIIQHNSFANAYTYNPSTGVYTSWTENVNGNWQLTGSVGYGRALGKKKFWHIDGSFSTTINQSTDMTSLTGQTDAQRNRVTSTRWSFSPSLRYQKEKLSFTLKADGAWQHLHRSIEVSNLPTNVYDFSYGVNANYQLPWNLTIDTDLQMHSRRGYAEEEMNDNRLYWDATLTKSWKQGRWVAKVKGYDLLGQVTHWQYYVNSQGRYETWTNNMRRYVLFSLAYRFSLSPKK